MEGDVSGGLGHPLKFGELNWVGGGKDNVAWIEQPGKPPLPTPLPLFSMGGHPLSSACDGPEMLLDEATRSAARDRQGRRRHSSLGWGVAVACRACWSA